MVPVFPGHNRPHVSWIDRLRKPYIVTSRQSSTRKTSKELSLNDSLKSYPFMILEVIVTMAIILDVLFKLVIFKKVPPPHSPPGILKLVDQYR
jgi:hypothetical protein